MSHRSKRTEILRRRDESKQARRAKRRAAWVARHKRAWSPNEPEARDVGRAWSMRGLRRDRGPGQGIGLMHRVIRELGDLAVEHGLTRREGIRVGLEQLFADGAIPAAPAGTPGATAPPE